MPTNNSLLTDISQLDELNKEVWADSVREREITQRVKPKFGDISSPSQNTVNEPESKATETLPLWTKWRNEVGVSETVDLLTRKMRFGKPSNLLQTWHWVIEYDSPAPHSTPENLSKPPDAIDALDAPDASPFPATVIAAGNR
jgi:hypothetical protein